LTKMIGVDFYKNPLNHSNCLITHSAARVYPQRSPDPKAESFKNPFLAPSDPPSISITPQHATVNETSTARYLSTYHSEALMTSARPNSGEHTAANHCIAFGQTTYTKNIQACNRPATVYSPQPPSPYDLLNSMVFDNWTNPPAERNRLDSMCKTTGSSFMEALLEANSWYIILHVKIQRTN
jgi:hypothetical protein